MRKSYFELLRELPRVTLAKPGKLLSCGSGQDLHKLPRVVMANRWMQVTLAGGWKKCQMDIYLHGKY